MENKRLVFFEKQLLMMNMSLTKSEKKIADYIRSNPEDFTQLSITDISENIGTSIAAITRFTKKMGYEKLQDLKLAITRDLESSGNRKHTKQYENIDDSDDVLTISQKVLQKNVESIRDI